MARTVVETRIQDRTARSRLAVRNKPYWRTLSEGAHLGYRRGARKGTWVARYFCIERDAYVTGAIAEADDIRDANDRDILNYKQAFDAALRWIEIATRKGPVASDPDMTVASAVCAYIETRDARRSSRAGRAVHFDAHYSLTRYVLEDTKLPYVKLATLAEGDLRAWQLRIARKKASSLQRVVNDLKAALNSAFETHRKVLPADLPVTIKYGLKVDAPEALLTVARENQILSDDQVRRIPPVRAPVRLP